MGIKMAVNGQKGGKLHRMQRFTADCRRASEKKRRGGHDDDDNDNVEELISKQLRM
jgi:hypothetical protein